MTDLEKTYAAHRDEWSDAAKNVHDWESTLESLKDTNNSDYWIHYQMYSKLDPIIENYPGKSWLTVGDGRFGRDAHYLAKKGVDVLATDIGTALLKTATERGFITKFGEENAERLSFKDKSFDFALCKDAFHHFPRPYLALY